MGEMNEDHARKVEEIEAAMGDLVPEKAKPIRHGASPAEELIVNATLINELLDSIAAHHADQHAQQKARWNIQKIIMDPPMIIPKRKTFDDGW